MAKLDVMKAGLAGFGVIGRNPGAVVIWALFLFVVGMLPTLCLMGGMFSSIAQLAEMETQGAEPTIETLMPFFGAMLALIPVQMIGGLILATMISGAIFRAVLFPEEKRWFYLRLGARELWLGLVIIVAWIIGFAIYLGLCMLMLPVMMISDAASGGDITTTSTVGTIMIFPLLLGMLAIFTFIGARFGLGLPMTFAESNFRLFHSWSITRGNGWRMVLLVLLLAAILFGFEIVLWMIMSVGLVAIASASVVSGAFTEASVDEFFRQDPSIWIATLMPWVIGGALVACLFWSLLTVVFTAPWAEAYRQLEGGEPEADPVIAG